VKRAWSYIRVSSEGQVRRAETERGFSIEAQQLKTDDQARALDAICEHTYTDMAKSGRSVDRPALQQMLSDLKVNPPDYVIVHKLDRLARNRFDDAQIVAAIQAAGAQLVSCTEQVDETAPGKLLHGIMASMAEFYSANLANEVITKSTEKAKRGGTLGPAPIGYLNVRKIIDGREVRTIAIDPERAPLVRWAFVAYATGNYSLNRLHEELDDRGLRTRPTRQRPARMIVRSALATVLKNRYYIGTVRYRGVEYPGSHPPLIDKETFSRVQQVLSAHTSSTERDRKHRHYLKGTVFCARCGSRLVFARAKGHGGTYHYFFCIGRQRRNGCEQPYVQIADVEAAVIRDAYADLQLKPDEVAQVRECFETYLADRERANATEIKRQGKRIAKLRAEQKKLLDAHYAEAIPLDLLHDEQARITRELANADQRLAETELQASEIRETLENAFTVALNCAEAYARAGESLRRQWNQVYFNKLWVRDRDIDGMELGDGISEFYALHRSLEVEADGPGRSFLGPGSSKEALVGREGIEPSTLGLRVPCSTN
jgi:site-specific DNA recombinase